MLKTKHNPRVGHGKWLRHHQPVFTRQFGACSPPREPDRLQEKMFDRRVNSIRRIGHDKDFIFTAGGNGENDSIVLFLCRGTKQDTSVTWERDIVRGQFKSGWRRVP